MAEVSKGDSTNREVGMGVEEQESKDQEGSEPRPRRHRKLTEKGQDYEHEVICNKKLGEIMKELKRCYSKMEESMKTNSDVRLIKEDHKIWLTLYEEFADIVDSLNLINPDTEIEQEDRLSLLKMYKDKIDGWFTENVDTRDSVSQQRSNVSRQSRASKASSLKSRLKEEQVELQEKLKYLKEVRELEIEKLTLKLKEEELAIRSRLNLATAKRQMLGDEENISVNMRHEQMGDYTSKLLETLPDSSPRRPVFQEPYPARNVFVPGSIAETASSEKDNDTITSELGAVLRQLRMPTPEIQKFTGNPLEYKKFLRQFTTKIVSNCTSDDERFHYLEQFTDGEARRVVNEFSYFDAKVGYELALKELDDRYGNDDILANAFVKRALDWQIINHDNPKRLDEYAVFLSECNGAIQSIEAVKVLQYPDTMKKLVSKLPYNLQERFRGIAFSIKERNDTVRFKHLVDFVKSEAKKACDPTYGREALASLTRKTEGRFTPRQSNQPLKGSFATAQTNSKHEHHQHSGGSSQAVNRNADSKFDSFTSCIYCRDKSHKIETCNIFSKLKHQEKGDFLRSKGLCFSCLKFGHRSFECHSRLTCNKCGRKHPTSLHNDEWVRKQDGKNDDIRDRKLSACNSLSITNAAKDEYAECTMAVLPVKLKLKDGLKSVSTYAFLDPGSNVSFCTNTLLEELGGTGRRMEIRLETMGQPCTVNTLAVQGLQVCDLEMTHVVDLPCVYTKEKMPISAEHIPTDEDIAPWLHLGDVVLPKLDVQIGLLIGNNVPDAYSPLQVRTGPKGSPHATQSRLGWIVWNVLRPQKGETMGMSVNRAEVTAIEKEEGLRELDRLVRHSMNLEFPERVVDDKLEPSQEDKQFLIQAESSVEVVNGHYTLNLPIRNPQMYLPNNMNQALQRLDHLKRKMKDYKQVMAKLLKDGHAELVTAEDKDGPRGRTWYLPHHGVYHPHKPGKLRVVYDCSANYQGQALNKVLIQGPDLTNRLLGILLRFRQERVAVMADVESMFHQVGVHETDRNLLRFLWWPDGNIDVEPEIYRMTVHTFGIISSPSIANFALRRTAEDYTDKFEQTVIEGIKKNFYVDDYLTSVPTIGKAIKLIQDTSCLLKQGGFRLTKWTSNNAEVVKSVPEVDRSKEMKLIDVNQEMPSERALGVYWKTEYDVLGFTTLKKSVPFTRRGILSLCSSVYDPLGITAPFTLIPKGILQDLCRLGIGWDDKLDERYSERWKSWIDELDILPELEVPRCYKPEEMGQVVSCQLHNFSDASEVGYGVVSYLRLEDSNGDVHCSFVLGKSRVTPLKKITVPRLELAAATTMVKISAMLERELDYDIDEVFFWTDSTSVLKYIQNETCRFHTYVANRISVIKEASSIKQWRYVPTTENPADYASRGLTMKALLQTPQWLQGPYYIWKSVKDWPEQATLSGNLCEDPEVKGTVCNVKVSCNADVMERLLNKFSDWLMLKRVTAWILIARTNLRQLAAERKRIDDDLTKRGLSGKEFGSQMELQMTHYRKMKQSDGCVKKLTVDYLQRAEVEVIKYVQSQHYPNEKNMLSCGKMISKSSNVIKLDPFMVEGVIRVGGRLENSTLPFEAKYPVLLPKESPISKLILLDAHQSVGHMGKNAILASVRQRYWIVGGKNVIKKILSRCVICQKYQAQPLTQKMANLPMERVNDQPPFSQVGIDYFGPFQIKHGRSTVKRYGVIFTCLVVRAVHLELSSDLTTDSCIQAIRRFIARRGPVKYIRSDNGSNLVGAERELRESIQNLDHDKIQDFLLNRQIEWEFNTPTASNFGGVWERLIRLVRKVMYSVLHSQNLRLDDESLRTLFCEVEAILNSRPISEMPDSPNDLGALTPNHILLFRCGEEIPPVVNIPDKGVNYCQRRWKQIQYLANIFWTKWTRQYLPLLQERQKWCVERENLKRDDLVLIVDSSPRNSWAMGRVVTVLKDRHGLARSVELKTQAGTVFRPVNKLCRVMEANLE